MANDVMALFTAASCEKLEASLATLTACVAQLSDAQVWSRGGEHENAIGNLILHLDGNIRQWILHGLGNQPDVRIREEEFAATHGPGGAALMAQLAATVHEARAIISQTTAEHMLETITPQPGRSSSTVLGAIYMVVGHMQQHVGQAIVLTKQMTGRDLDLSIPRTR